MKAFNQWKSQSLSNKIFDIINYSVMIFVLLVCFYPLYYIVIASLSSEVTGVYFWPKDFSFQAYSMVLEQKDVWIGYLNTVIYAVGAVVCSLCVTVPAAFALSRKDFMGRGAIMGMMMVTMFISGGMVPAYLNMYRLGLLDTRWVIIIAGLFSTYHVIVARTFFRTTIPDELLEAAQMDGCGMGRFFATIALPLSKPILAVLGLYAGVAQWNSYFTEMIYLRDLNKYPLTLILRRYLSSVEEMARLISEGVIEESIGIYKTMQLATVMQYCLIVISTLPMLIVYPFIQKYFAKGVMVGSVKG